MQAATTSSRSVENGSRKWPDTTAVTAMPKIIISQTTVAAAGRSRPRLWWRPLSHPNPAMPLRPLNPTPYKVSVSMDLYHYIHDLWMQEIPVAELS